jgi:hypothetical protein
MDPASPALSYVLQLVTLLPSLVMLAAAALYARTARSAPSRWLLAAASGQFLVAAANRALSAFFTTQLLSRPEVLNQLQWATQILVFVGLAFSYMFAIALFVVLRGVARHTSASAESA